MKRESDKSRDDRIDKLLDEVNHFREMSGLKSVFKQLLGSKYIVFEKMKDKMNVSSRYSRWNKVDYYDEQFESYLEDAIFEMKKSLIQKNKNLSFLEEVRPVDSIKADMNFIDMQIKKMKHSHQMLQQEYELTLAYNLSVMEKVS